MKGILRTLVTGILIFAAALAVWKLFGGDVGGFFEGAWAFLYTIIDAVSNVMVDAWNVFAKE